jgi:hypothetical protein
MHIDVIDNLDDLKALRGNWDAVYAADPEAQFFLSSGWQSDFLANFWTVWFVLAAKRNESDSEYVAFLPMRTKPVFDKRVGFYNEITFGGGAYSDYAGILSLPEVEAEAVPAFAEYLKRELNWAWFSMDNLRMSDERRRLFVSSFDKALFRHKEIDYKDGALDNSICPSIDLPSDWDAYLETLSSNNRQKIRRLLRKVDASEDYRITFADADTYDRDLTTLLGFWKTKWAPTKPKIDDLVQRNYTMLSCCAANGTLFLPVFWHGDRPVAALATLIDPVRKSLLFFITGRDETYSEMPAGYLLHAHSIRHAIAEGFSTYDFLRGDEPYKFLFAPQQQHRLKPVAVGTKTGRNLGGKLDPRCGPEMMRIAL